MSILNTLRGFAAQAATIAAAFEESPEAMLWQDVAALQRRVAALEAELAARPRKLGQQPEPLGLAA